MASVLPGNIKDWGSASVDWSCQIEGASCIASILKCPVSGVGRNCSINQDDQPAPCYAKATLFCNKCDEAACDQHEEMMNSGMMEGMIQRTNEGHFKTGRGLTEGPLMVLHAREEMKRRRQEEMRRR